MQRYAIKKNRGSSRFFFTHKAPTFVARNELIVFVFRPLPLLKLKHYCTVHACSIASNFADRDRKRYYGRYTFHLSAMHISPPFPTGTSEVPYHIIEAAGTETLNQFLSPADNQDVSAATMRAVDSGREEAYFVPIVRLVTRIAIAACSDPDLFLPSEVIHRARVAEGVAKLIARRGANNGLFLEAYHTDPHLRRGLRENPVFPANLRDARYLQDQCSAPFSEAARLAGGGYYALGRKGVPNARRADIVAASRSLPLAANIPAKVGETAPLSMKIFAYLGSPLRHARKFCHL
jgi:hypothetical protein